MEVTCVVAARGTSFAATGPASGCKTSPAITKAASKRHMNRYKTMVSILHGTGGPERSTASQVRQRRFRKVKPSKISWLTRYLRVRARKLSRGEGYPERPTHSP